MRSLVGDAAVLGRDVEVDAQEHALAGDVGVIEGAERLGHECTALRRAKIIPAPALHVATSATTSIHQVGSMDTFP